MIFYVGIDYTMLSSSFAQRKMYGGDADPYFNEPTWNERMPSAGGAAPAAAAAPSVMFVYNIGQQAQTPAPAMMAAPTLYGKLDETTKKIEEILARRILDKLGASSDYPHMSYDTHLVDTVVAAIKDFPHILVLREISEYPHMYPPGV